MKKFLRLITSAELARLYQVSLRTVEGWRRRKVGPTPLYLPNMRSVRYDEAEALACLEQYKSNPIGRVRT